MLLSLPVAPKDRRATATKIIAWLWSAVNKLSQMMNMKMNKRIRKERMYPNKILLFREKVKMITLLRRGEDIGETNIKNNGGSREEIKWK